MPEQIEVVLALEESSQNSFLSSFKMLPDIFSYYLHQQFVLYKLYCTNCCFLSMWL